jgi:hypothetical protein
VATKKKKTENFKRAVLTPTTPSKTWIGPSAVGVEPIFAIPIHRSLGSRPRIMVSRLVQGAATTLELGRRTTSLSRRVAFFYEILPGLDACDVGLRKRAQNVAK